MPGGCFHHPKHLATLSSDDAECEAGKPSARPMYAELWREGSPGALVRFLRAVYGVQQPCKDD